MKKLFRLLFRLFLFTILIFGVIVLYNALTQSSKQLSVETVEKISVPDQALNRLSTVVQQATVSYPDRIDTTAFESFKQFTATAYPLVDSFLERTVINEYSLVFKWPGKKQALPPVLLMGHIDVVPVEKAGLKDWTKGPYSGLIDDQFIWGRGTLDDKMSIIGVLEAMELLLEKGYQPERTIYLAGGHDEEIGGINGARAIANWFENQAIRFEYILDEGSIILRKALPGLKTPAALIGIAEKGYVTLKLEVNLEKGGHSSMPPTTTAIGILSDALVKLKPEVFGASMEGPVRQMLDHVGPEMDWPYRAIFTNLWLFEGILKSQFAKEATTNAITRTTIAPTIIQGGVKENVLPTQSEVMINFRIMPGETIASVKERVAEVIDDERITISSNSGGFENEPSPTSSTSSFGYGTIQKTVLEIFPETVVLPSLVIAGTDSRHYHALSEHVYRFSPMVLERSDLPRIHGVDERIGKEQYKDLIRFYHQLILNSSR